MHCTGALKMLCTAANYVAQHCFGKQLDPGATMSDHCDSAKNQLTTTWPSAFHGQC